MLTVQLRCVNESPFQPIAVLFKTNNSALDDGNRRQSLISRPFLACHYQCSMLDCKSLPYFEDRKAVARVGFSLQQAYTCFRHELPFESEHSMTKSMSWHRIKLSLQEYESGELHILQGAFHAAYIARNGPEGMAMFGCWVDDDCYFVYISPRSVRHVLPILDAYSAKRCDMPEISSIVLIYGDESSRSSFEVEFEA